MPVGAAEALIEGLPVFLFGGTAPEATHVDARCSICMGDYDPGADRLKRLPCGHSYHIACIDAWLVRNRREVA